MKLSQNHRVAAAEADSKREASAAAETLVEVGTRRAASIEAAVEDITEIINQPFIP
jgi:hypothetical protein